MAKIAFKTKSWSFFKEAIYNNFILRVSWILICVTSYFVSCSNITFDIIINFSA